MRFAGISRFLLILLLAGLRLEAQVAGVADPLATLSTDERIRFNAASKAFSTQQFAEALPVFKSLLATHQENLLLAKYASEAAIDAGDLRFAETTLKPIEAVHPEDWQATALMARIYAEVGDKAGRDREMTRMADLQRQGVTPAKMTQYIVEKVHLAEGKTLIVWQSLVPWGNFKVQNYGRLLDADGQVTMRMTLESGDFDQPGFAKEHPQEAAAGKRRYSLDTYRAGPVAANDQRSETQALIGFLDKKPAYDELRADFIAIAEGKKPSLATNVHPAR